MGVCSVIPCLFALCVRKKYLLHIHLLQMLQRTRIWFGDFRGVVEVALEEAPPGPPLAVKPEAASCTGFHLVVLTTTPLGVACDGTGGGW